MTARLAYWYYTHPRLGRPALVVALLHVLSVLATASAPQAVAATNTALLSFTGLTDSYGVPIGAYYLSLASLTERITETGPDITLNPDSWARWMMQSLATMLTHLGAAEILTGLASFYIGVIGLALWIFKITVSTYWLSIVAEIARAISGAFITAVAQLGVLMVCVPLGVFIGAMTIKRGESGRGWMMILIALGLPAVSVAVFYDPAGAMYGPNGVLEFARSAGFSVAAAATHNSAATGIDAVTGSLITQLVREPLQLWNFGHVIDQVGGCGSAWSQAMMAKPAISLDASNDGGVRAMEACGNQAALSYAQNLDGTNIGIGIIFVACGLVFGFFMIACGWAVLKVSVKAIWTTVIILPTLWVGSVPGAPQQRAASVTWQFFKHGLEVMAYVVFVSVIGLAIQRIVAAPLPAELGGTNPVAHVLMMAACSVAGWYLLRRIHAEFDGGSGGGSSMMGHAKGTAAGMAMHGAVGGAGKGAKALGGKAFSSRGRTPWDAQDAKAQQASAAGDAAAVHGPPKPGFDPITKSGPGTGPTPGGPATPGGGGPAPSGGPSPAGGAAAGGATSQAATAASGAAAAKTAGLSVVATRAAQAAHGAVSSTPRRTSSSSAQNRQQSGAATQQPGPASGPAATGGDQPRAVPPISTADQRPQPGGAAPTPAAPAGRSPQPDPSGPRPPSPPPHKVKPITRDETGERPQ